MPEILRHASTSFAHTFNAARLFAMVDERHTIGHVVPIGRRMTALREVALHDRNGDRRRCFVEAFDRGRQILMLIVDDEPVSTSVLLTSRTAAFQATAGQIRLSLRRRGAAHAANSRRLEQSLNRSVPTRRELRPLYPPQWRGLSERVGFGWP